ncbi:hypothetical protein FF011L_36700 [Roseimaritima multifibrata]|uniref:Uncharacterized protein n=1 Tax=Roseimaritima multifibrata TaxID=1930274 RepID=A0A517MJ54_9BACT|nr:hypothetical protein FF011L_36700 [Roseimaritima multifibrata]
MVNVLRQSFTFCGTANHAFPSSNCGTSLLSIYPSQKLLTITFANLMNSVCKYFQNFISQSRFDHLRTGLQEVMFIEIKNLFSVQD